MGQIERLLNDYPDEEKGAYLCVMASIARADSIATDDELEFLHTLSEGANLSKEQEESVIRAGITITDTELNCCLKILKNSALRFPLITDIISFAKMDGKYSPEEKADVEKIAVYLQVNKEQFSVLDQFVQKSSDSMIDPQTVTKVELVESLGLKDKFHDAGINPNGITQGLLGIQAPLVIDDLLQRGIVRKDMGLYKNKRFGIEPRMSGIGSMISILSGERGYRGMRNISSRLSG